MFTFTRYSQQDPSWKNQAMGFDPNATIGSLGCLLTDLAMVATGFGFNETPASLTNKLMQLGPNVGFIGALVVPAVLPRVLPGLIFRDFLDCHDSPAPMERIDAALAAGWPVIVQVDYSPAAGLQSHWLILYDKQGSDYLLQDPWPYPPDTTPVKLSNSRFAFAGSPAKIIQAVVWLEGPPRPVTPVNKPINAVSVYAIEDNLAIRAQPLIAADNLLKRVGQFAELYSLEAQALTLQKVGSANQWLNVLDPDGTQGYAAAWYLNTKPEVPGQPAQPPVPPGAALTVYATVDQLALRSSSTVSADTLIKRLPVNSALIVLESGSDAVAKIGVVNAWLNVQDSTGAAGFVAAWYTTLTPPTGLGPTTPPPTLPSVPGTQKLTVTTTVPSLALRSQPNISPDTLIRRVPLGTDLLVAEPVDAALKKVGVNDQWLQVRDTDNSLAYIAAWYVKKHA